MANFFDQFDAPAAPAQGGNFFDQFDAPRRGAMDELTGATGPRFQLWPERLARGVASEIAGLPQASYDAAQQASAGMLRGPQATAGSEIPESALSQPLSDKAMEIAMMVAPATRFSPTTKTVPAATPTSDELLKSAKAAYQSPEVKDLRIAPQPVADLATQIENDLLQSGFRPMAGSGEAAFKITSELRPGPKVTAVTIDDIDAVRKALKIPSAERDLQMRPTAGATAAQNATRHIDEFLADLNLQPRHVLAGDAAAAREKLLAARGDWAAAKRSGEVDFRLNQAERQAAKSGSGMNIENARRQKIDRVSDYGLTPAEIARRDSIVLGTPIRNALRTVGKLGVSGGLSMALHAGAAMGTGGSTIPVTIAATILRKAGEKMTAREIAALNEAIRARSPLARGTPPLQLPAPRRSPLAAPAAGGLFQYQSAPK